MHDAKVAENSAIRKVKLTKVAENSSHLINSRYAIITTILYTFICN